ncbi:MAG: hypothetical protein JW825_00665 [Candidatus Methanofastidiosa archaeon]|nr:hypothetical protein [Candidatus Methanofastidiosa archaeon]
MDVIGKENYSLDVEGLEISIKKEEKKSLRPHIAKTLENHGVVEIPCLTSVSIKKLIMEERSGALPNELPDDFYELLRHSAKKMDVPKEREALRRLAADLVRIRIEKIFKISLQANMSKFKIQPEERVFLLNLTTLMGRFKKDLLGGEL